jgi:hypothetical protein
MANAMGGNVMCRERGVCAKCRVWVQKNRVRGARFFVIVVVLEHLFGIEAFGVELGEFLYY